MTELADIGKDVKALETRPILQPGLDFYYDCYRDLSYDRPVGMGVGSIPWSSIIKWCEIHAVHDIDDISTCIRYIRALERTDNEIADRRAKRK